MSPFLSHLIVALTWLAAAQASTDLDTFKQRADAAREANHLEEAAGIYREAVRLHPKWTEGHWYLGTISYELGRYDVCRSELAQVVTVQTKNGAAWAFKGLCAFHTRRYGPALDDLTRAQALGLGDDPDFPAVVGYHRAILLLRAGKFEAAVEEIRGFVRGGNIGPTIVEALGVSMLRLAKLPSELTPQERDMAQLSGQAAVFAYQRMADAADKAYALLMARYPDAPNVHYTYGLYLVHEKPDEALEQFKLELQRSPDHVLARLQLVQELIRRGDFAGAMPYAVDAARLAPGNFVARRELGRAKLHAGDVKGAIVELEAAKRLEPSSPSVRFNLARAYLRAGRELDAKRERAEFTRLQEIQEKKRTPTSGAPDEEPVEQQPQ
jgi:tetratricopeptide (TPR) repeat protein